MAYKTFFTHVAEKDLEKLDSVVKKRIYEKLKFYEKNPLKYAEKLSRKELGEYRYRIGNHRAIFDLKGKKILILRIGRRDKIYK